MDAFTLTADNARYPARLHERRDTVAPAKLTMLGNLELLTLPKTALFCSARCPGSAILKTYDQAARWREEKRCVISGFHSPMEQDCLRILLRGKSPVIICPARSLTQRISPEWKQPLREGRMLILSGFKPSEKRMTTDLAIRRNELVAALADEVWFAHVTPGGHLENLAQRLKHLPREAKP